MRGRAAEVHDDLGAGLIVMAAGVWGQSGAL